MRALGYSLIVVGFLVGALTAVLEELAVPWRNFTIALLVGVVGIAIVRVSAHREARAEGKLASNMRTLADSMARIVERLGWLDRRKEEFDPYAIRHQIDQLFPDDLNAFVEARKTIAHVYGLEAYADVMNYFAAGERYLNRMWSASADGYIDEVHAYLGKAHEQFVGALAQVQRLQGTQA